MQKIIALLLVVTLSVWIAVFSLDNNLEIIACDVGQGDAILIQRLNTQVLIDGGPNRKVLDCLGRHMPYWDRELELVINTHPEIDHYGGLIDVFKTYKVLNFASNGHESSSQEYQVLKKLVGGEGVTQLILNSDTDLRVGLIYLDILWPKLEQISNKTNDNGVVILLKYDQFKALFTADVENSVSDILSENNNLQNINYLKVNHHGSKNGLSQKLLDVTDPDVAVISVSAKNSYGHPSIEVLNMLKNKNIKILRTDELGDVINHIK